MDQIPIESLNLPKDLTFPAFLTKNGKIVARIIGGEELEEKKKAEALRSEMLATIIYQKAVARGLTPEIADELLKDIS